MSDSPVLPPPQPQGGRFSPALVMMIVIPVIGLLIAAGFLISDSAQKQPANTPAPAVVGSVGQEVPDIALTDLDGQPVDLADYRGRPIFLNFWGTWCPPCIRELPEMQAFAESQGDTGALVIASNNSESPETIRNYFAENNLDLPDVLFVQDPDSVLYRWFGVWQMPTTYLIDEDGVVRFFKYGAFTSVAEFHGFLDEMYARRAGS